MSRLSRPERFAARTFYARILTPILAAAVLCLCPDTLSAQGVSTGEVHGNLGPLGMPSSPGVRVILHNGETGFDLETLTQQDGSFLFPSILPGAYRLTLPGRPDVGIFVVPGATTEADPGADSTASTFLPPQTPDEDDDGLLSLGGLEPGVIASGFTDPAALQQMEGVPLGKGSDPAADPAEDADSAEQTVGPAYGLARGRHAGIAYTFAQGSVREFRTGIGSYSAQAGSAGGILTRITRQGGEQLHGSVFLNLRSSALAATNALSIATSYRDGIVTSATVKPHDLLSSLGFTAGGPILRLKTLRYFGAVDLERRGYPAISSPADPNFYNLTAIQRALLHTRGVSDSAVNAGLNYVSSLTGRTPRRADQDIEFGRLDWTAKGPFRPSIEYNRARWNAPAGLISSPVVARGRASLGNSQGSVDQLLGRITLERSGRIGAELRLGYTRDLQFERPQTPLSQEPAIGPGGLAPEVNIGPNGLLFGTPASLSQIAYPDEKRFEIGGTISVVRGRHLLQLGGSFARIAERASTLANAAGTFLYDSGETRGYAGGLVDFLTDATFNVHTLPDGGCPRIDAAVHDFCFRSYTQAFGAQQVAFSTQDWSGFVEDTWRPLRHLTLHAGLRYDYTLLPLPQHANPVLDSLFQGQGATSVFPEDRNNFGPRLSAVVEPLGRAGGTFKFGYGAYYGRLPGATIKAALSDTAEAASTTRIRIRPATETVCPQETAVGFGYPCSFIAPPGGLVAATTSALLFDRHFRLPLIQQASLAYERDLGGRSSFSLAYVLNLDRQLPGSTDLNIAPSTRRAVYQLQGGPGARGVEDGQIFTLPLYTARLSSQFGPVTDVVSRSNATYNALQVQVRSRAVRGLLLAGEYTWSRALDFGQSASATPRTNSQLDPFSIGYDKGVSSLNFPHAFHAEAVWSPLGESHRRGLSGWNLTALTTARSGRPYSYDLSGGTRLPGGHTSLNGAGGALYLPTVGRNTLHLPPTLKTDMTLSRDIRLREHLHGRAALQVTNLFNHQVISSINQRAYLVGKPGNGSIPLVFQSASEIAVEGLNTVAFGAPTATGTGQSRERQLGLRMQITF